MTTPATGSFFNTVHFEITPFHELEGAPTLSHYVQKDVFHGAIEGEGVMQCVFIQHVDGGGEYMGLQRVTGRLGDRQGTFVLRHQGTFQGTNTSGTWSVVPGSATGGLTGLKGEGGFSYISGVQDIPYHFDYEIG